MSTLKNTQELIFTPQVRLHTKKKMGSVMIESWIGKYKGLLIFLFLNLENV